MIGNIDVYTKIRFEIEIDTVEDGVEILKWVETSELHIHAELNLSLWNMEFLHKENEIHYWIKLFVYNEEDADIVRKRFPETPENSLEEKLLRAGEDNPKGDLEE